MASSFFYSFGGLRNLYWRLRAERRDSARRRYWYRRIRAERYALSRGGTDPELMRLYCRYLATPTNQKAYLRFMVEARARGFDPGEAFP